MHAPFFFPFLSALRKIFNRERHTRRIYDKEKKKKEEKPTSPFFFLISPLLSFRGRASHGFCPFFTRKMGFFSFNGLFSRLFVKESLVGKRQVNDRNQNDAVFHNRALVLVNMSRNNDGNC